MPTLIKLKSYFYKIFGLRFCFFIYRLSILGRGMNIGILSFYMLEELKGILYHLVLKLFFNSWVFSEFVCLFYFFVSFLILIIFSF